MWESVRTNNGIMVLLQLLSGKGRLTDADSLRMLSCHALAGLARSDTVKQIISNLPLLTTGQLQSKNFVKFIFKSRKILTSHFSFNERPNFARQTTGTRFVPKIRLAPS
jgi:hypothetical protein